MYISEITLQKHCRKQHCQIDYGAKIQQHIKQITVSCFSGYNGSVKNHFKQSVSIPILFPGFFGKSTAGILCKFKSFYLSILSMITHTVKTNRLIIIFRYLILGPKTAFFQNTFSKKNIMFCAAGVDMSTPKPILDAIGLFDETLDEMERLLEE